MRQRRTPGLVALLGTVGLAATTLVGCGGPSDQPEPEPSRRASNPPSGVRDGTADTTTADAPTELGATEVRFLDRTVDLAPFLLGFPYSNHHVNVEDGRYLYLHRTPEGTVLRSLDLPGEGTVDLGDGSVVSDIDWSTRTYRPGDVHDASGRLLLLSDENNDERTNVYALNLSDGSLDQLTNSDYTYGFDLSNDGKRLAYLARKGRTEPFDTALRVMDLESGDDRVILWDRAGSDRFTWSSLAFTPDDSAIVLNVQHDGNRNTKSLARVDLTAESPAFEFLHDTRKTRYSLWTVDGWISDDTFLYASAETGFLNLYRYDLGDRTSLRLTDFRDELGSVELLDTEPPTALAVLRRPHESELQLLDVSTGQVLHKETVPAQLSILDAHGSSAVLSMTSLTTPFAAERLTVQRRGILWSFERAPLCGVADDLLAQISHLDVAAVSYPTFDKKASGEARSLHAFSLTPKRPRADDQKLVVITSFYGGSNRFSTLSQILGSVGVATFSPAPRGSSGFGAEFGALNDGDLGGDEIIDILYAGRWLAGDGGGYLPWQIGVHGGSHGGYATMRCLTFPPETNGRGASWDFGFGWSHAGFSNIVTFYESCNIPDWVIKEAGDPATERDKLLDRSPITHVERLTAPLLLTHGSNDWRVPVEESRSFHRAAAALGRPVEFVEFEGQGHSIRGFENQVRYYQAVLSFLERVVRAKGGEFEVTAGG